MGFCLDEIKELIIPSQEEQDRISAHRDKVVELLEQHADVLPFSIVITPGGSTAKGTNLRGNADIDIFLRAKTQEKNLSDAIGALVALVAEALGVELERIHGSRDYFTFSYEGMHVEIVPVKYVESYADVDNVTDMSPLHVLWAREQLTPELADDVRLLKQFCKANKLYGAESYVQGLSGHVLEILTIYYGGFEQVIDAITNWGEVTVIDVNETGQDVFSEMNQAKLVSPLIVVDPVDPKRNAAAALCKEQYDVLKQRAQDYIKEPTNELFEIPVFSLDMLQSIVQPGQQLFVFSVVPLKGKEDIILTKVFKVFQFLERHLTLHDFSVVSSGWHPDATKSYIYYFVEDVALSKTVTRGGPPNTMELDVAKFRDVHPDAFEQDGKWYATVEREFTTPKECLGELIRQTYVTERVQEIKLVK